jgi:aryl-alcohol dehydrogenase-like predicted oxidoreductase
MGALQITTLARAPMGGPSGRRSVVARAARSVNLGKSKLQVSEMGLGAWSWGDKSGYWQNWTREDSLAAYKAALDAGITFIDTAAVYGYGQS